MNSVLKLFWVWLAPSAAMCNRVLCNCAKSARVKTRRSHGITWVDGYGKSILHTAKILRLSEDLPMVVEIVESLEKIEAFLPQPDEMVSDGY